MSTARAERISPLQFTRKQGQYLAFIHSYWLLNGRGPAEADLVRFFRVTPPSVHSMIVKLHELGLIAREPGVARSIRVAIPDECVPRLEHIIPRRAVYVTLLAVCVGKKRRAEDGTPFCARSSRS